MEFARKLEQGEVTIYAKLPNGFKIRTPFGNYNPDWALVFDNKDIKYIYFIAETKGSIQSAQLKGAEQGKIACAKYGNYFIYIIFDILYICRIQWNAIYVYISNCNNYRSYRIMEYIGVIVLWNTSGNSNNTQDYSKTDNNSSKDNDNLDDFILFNMFFNDKK